jgi:flagellar biosynthesis protein FlhF
MRIRSYFSGTVEAAMERARQELGDDALLLDVRETPPESRALGAYEVVLGAEPPAPATPPAVVYPDGGRIEGALSAFLAERGLGVTLATEIEREIEAIAGDRAVTEEDLKTTIARRVSLTNWVQPSPPVLLLAGPPGSGKTTTAVKLAIRLSQKFRRPALIIDADSRRVGGGAALARICHLAGIGLQAAAEPYAIAPLAEEAAGQPVVVDLPGFSRNDTPELGEWANALAKIPHGNTLLTLMATGQAADLLHVTQRLQVLQPAGLIATHWDETSSAAGVVTAAATARLPLWWLTNGQSIPEDLFEASHEAVFDKLLGLAEKSREPYAAAAASGRR